jgi:hypothetical protein
VVFILKWSTGRSPHSPETWFSALCCKSCSDTITRPTNSRLAASIRRGQRRSLGEARPPAACFPGGTFLRVPRASCGREFGSPLAGGPYDIACRREDRFLALIAHSSGRSRRAAKGRACVKTPTRFDTDLFCSLFRALRPLGSEKIAKNFALRDWLQKFAGFSHGLGRERPVAEETAIVSEGRTLDLQHSSRKGRSPRESRHSFQIKATNIEVNRKRKAADPQNSWLPGLASMEAERVSAGASCANQTRKRTGSSQPSVPWTMDRKPRFMPVSVWFC